MRVFYSEKITAVIICVLLLIVCAIVPSIYGRARDDSENEAEVAAAGGTSYTLSQFDGKLAVFQNGDTVPVEVYDVFIENLPGADRELLISKSLTTTSKTQLLLWIEDYVS